MLMTMSSVFSNQTTIEVIQIIIASLLSMFLCQLTKFIIFSIRYKRLRVDTLFTTGGMPSSHTSCVVTLVSMIAAYDIVYRGCLSYNFCVALTFAAIVIHDAMGVRFEASKHAKILNNLVVDEDLKTKQELGYGTKGQLKELLGHRGLEVLGGLIFGVVIAIIFALIFINVNTF